MYTLLCLKWIANKDLLYSYTVWNSTQFYVSAWMGEEFGGEWIHVHVWLCVFAVHLKLAITTLLISCCCCCCCWVTSVMSDSVRPYGEQPTRLLCPQDSPGISYTSVQNKKFKVKTNKQEKNFISLSFMWPYWGMS